MKKVVLAFVGLALFTTGCIKKKDLDFSNVTIDNWQPDWALPIFNSNLTLENVIQENSFVTVDAEGMYSLHYNGDLFYARAYEYITIPDQAYTSPDIHLTVPQNIPGFTGSITDSFSDHFTYTDPSGSKLSHIVLKTGNAVLQLSSTFQQNVSATVTFPTVKKGSTVLTIIADLTHPATSVTVPIDFGGFTIDLTNGGTMQNDLPYNIKYTLTGTGQALTPSGAVKAEVGMSNMTYSFMDGYLGTYNIPIPGDTIDVRVFDNTLTADIFIRNPKINLQFKNSFGLGVSAKFDSIYGLTNTGTKVDMVIPPVLVAGATTVGATATSSYTLDSTNSSVQNMFNPAPNHVVYNGHVQLNPAGVSSVYNFLTDSSIFSLDADAELPAWFRIIDFAMQDTFKLTLPEDTSLLQKAQFRMLMDNAFPLYGRIQLYFADANYNFLDSLVPTADDIVGEAPVDANGHVTGRTQKTTDFIMSHDQYNAMAPNVRYAVVRGTLKTSGKDDIKILSSNNLNVKLAFRFTLNVSKTDL